MKHLAVIAALLAIIAAGCVWLYGSLNAERREAEALLGEFSDTVATQDLEKIRASLQTLIADDAKITLEVKFHSITQPEGGNLMTQEFSKATFIPFVENVLYSLADYSYNPRLTAFAKGEGGEAAVEIASQDRAHGTSYFGGIAVGARFGTDTQCKGTVRYAGDRPQLSAAQCSVRLISVPRSEDLGESW